MQLLIAIWLGIRRNLSCQFSVYDHMRIADTVIKTLHPVIVGRKHACLPSAWSTLIFMDFRLVLYVFLSQPVICSKLGRSFEDVYMY